MRCKALAVFDNNKIIDSHIPEMSSPSFWNKTAAKAIESTIRQEIQALSLQMESGNHISYPSALGFIHVLKLNHLCCTVICDQELSTAQLKYLTLYMLCKQISLRNIARDLNQYTQDYRLATMQSKLPDDLSMMKSVQRQLDNAMAKQLIAANDVEDPSEAILKQASQANSWWSLSHNIL